MEDKYKYTQVGVVTILLILLAGVFTAYVVIAGLRTSPGSVQLGIGLLVAGLLILALASFYSFTIQIVAGELDFWFGFGVGKRSFDIADIRSIEIVKTPWYYFWGIKSIPGGWLYSIAPGGEAIELVFMDGKKIHLGTNRAAEIKKRIETVMGPAV